MKLKPDVLAVLSELTFSGNEARIHGQVDRKLYIKVNEALEALGGKWNRKAKAHIFPGDAAELLDVVVITGEVTTARDIGFFPTPPTLATELVAMAMVRPEHDCLEPSAGTGNIVRAMRAVGAQHITVVERDRKMRRALCDQDDKLIVIPVDDFIDGDKFGEYDRCVMNPPFNRVGRGDALDHARRAFSLLRPHGVLVSVLPSSAMWRKNQRTEDFRAFVSAHGGSLVSLPDHSFRSSGTDVGACVLHMTRT